MLDADPGDAVGPVADVRASLEFLRGAFTRQPTA
jgi:hypothetical protein